MTGVILAGGNGTRLRPLTHVANKHLLPVYNRLMIHLPIQTLINYGCTTIIIVSGGESIGKFTEVLGDGSRYGVRFLYCVQEQANGVAEALLKAEGLLNGVFPVILGDNYFSETPVWHNEPFILTSEVTDPERFGVLHNNKIIEKPVKPESNKAVTGFYVFDDKVFEYIKTLEPSDRGELEITDVNNWYLENGAKAIEYKGYWRDMGTFDTLLEVANLIQVKTSK